MSFKNYLNKDNNEEAIHGIILEKSNRSVKKEYLGFTKTRVFYFSQYKDQNRVYREFPLEKLRYIEHGWHDKRIVMLIAGLICLICGIISFFFTFGALVVIGLVLIIKGLKQYGYLIVNRWILRFHSRSYLKPIERFIELIHFAEQQSNYGNESEINNGIDFV